MIFHTEGNRVTNEYASGRTSNHGIDPSTTGTWTCGDFGEAKADVAKEAGKRIITSILIYGVACSW